MQLSSKQSEFVVKHALFLEVVKEIILKLEYIDQKKSTLEIQDVIGGILDILLCLILPDTRPKQWESN